MQMSTPQPLEPAQGVRPPRGAPPPGANLRQHAALHPALWTVTGTVVGDLGTLRGWLDAVSRETTAGGAWKVLDREDPMQTLVTIEGYVVALNVSLVALGFTPPSTDCTTDPMGFVEDNAQFLSSIAAFVLEPAVTVH